MNSSLEKLEQAVTEWPQISAHPHRFGGREFKYSRAELGHVHRDGTVDIPMPRSIHDLLLHQGLAEQHRWVPNSGWITFRLRHPEDLQHALWLLRLSYLRYALKSSADPQEWLRREDAEWHFGPGLKSLLSPFLPESAITPATPL